MKRLYFIVGICVMALALWACGASDNTGTNTGTTNTSATTTPVASQQHFKVGDTVTVGTTWKVVVNGISTDDGGQFSTLKSGNTYVIVDVSLTNISNKEQNISSALNFTFKDSTGKKYDETIDTNVNGSTPDGKVEANDTLRGNIAYEVPSDQKSFTLGFAPDIISSGQTIWDLALS